MAVTDRCLKCGMLRHPPDMWCDSAVPLEKIKRLYNDGLSLTAIGEACGVSRQAISHRLRKAGIDPAARRAEVKAAKAAEVAQRRKTREVERLRRRRDQAWRLTVLKALADDLGCSIQTLGQYARGAGTYASSGYRREDHRTKLPHRNSPEGEALARDIDAIAAPWNVRHLVQYVDRRLA